MTVQVGENLMLKQANHLGIFKILNSLHLQYKYC